MTKNKEIKNNKEKGLPEEIRHFGMMIEEMRDDNKLITEQFGHINKKLDQIDVINSKLDQHTQILDQHTQILDQHTQILDQHTRLLNSHTEMIGGLMTDMTQ